jgi:L-seryl-tRNA(Ser) seleniumtransferase
MEPGREVKTDPRASLPAVEHLRQRLRERRPELPGWAALAAVRGVLEDERRRLADAPRGHAAAEEELLRRSGARAQDLAAARPRRVVNATGIVLHTNLGRAPLAAGAAAAVAAAAVRYGDLELDLATGRRSDRLAGVNAKLVQLSGAEAAHVVTNNAAAVLLVLDSLARGREVVVSRGELVEIGGSFRVAEIMRRAGVRLVEVGSTNRTHLRDYERAVGPETALLLKVHRSNFELRGFVAEAELPELVRLARRRGIAVLADLGSATLARVPGLPADAWAPAHLRAGADLVCFSGDKLLGGPQAGILLGRADLVAALREDPLARALRPDKLGIAALDWTLAAYLDGRAEREIPVLRQLLEPPERLEQRARSLARRLAGAAAGALGIAVRQEAAFVGGGSVPGFELPSWVIAIEAPEGAERTAARLRAAATPVVARVHEDRLLIDVRTLLDGDDGAVEAAVAEALAAAR